MSNSRRKTAVIFLNSQKKWKDHTHRNDKKLRALRNDFENIIPCGSYYRKIKKLCFVKCIPLLSIKRVKIWWPESFLEYKIYIK